MNQTIITTNSMIQNRTRKTIMQTRKATSALEQNSFLRTVLRFVVMLTMLCTAGVGDMWGEVKTIVVEHKKDGNNDTQSVSNSDVAITLTASRAGRMPTNGNTLTIGGKAYTAIKFSATGGDKMYMDFTPIVPSLTKLKKVEMYVTENSSTNTIVKGYKNATSYDELNVAGYIPASGQTPVVIDVTDYISYGIQSTGQLFCVFVVTYETAEEKIVYETGFNDWTNNAKIDDVPAEDKTYVHENKKTKDGQNITFTLFDAYKISDAKLTQNGATANVIATTKKTKIGEDNGDKTPSTITISQIESVTRLSFIHGATGSNRGLGLRVRGTKSDGTIDGEWQDISTSYASTSAGTKVDVDINRTNCELQFYNLAYGQYAFLSDLTIYGNMFSTVTEAPKAAKGDWTPTEEKWAYTINSATASAHIHYTINGGEEQTVEANETVVQLSPGDEVTAWATDSNGSLEQSENLSFTADAMPQTIDPTMALSTYSVSNKNFTVTLGGAQAGAVVKYSTDGSDPATGSTYTTPFTVGGNTTVKAIAIQEHYANSGVVSKKTLNPVSPGTEYISRDNGTSGDNVGIAYTLPSTHVGGQANYTGNGIKMNPRKINAQGANGVHIDVNPGFVITKIEGTAVNNYSGDVNLTAIHVDGSTTDNVLVGAPVTVHDNGTTPYASFSTANIQARKSLDLMIDCSQVNMLINVYYEFDDEITGITVNGDALSEEAFAEAKTGAGHELTTHYATAPELKVQTKEGYEYTMKRDMDSEGVNTYTYSILGTSVKVIASDVLPGIPEITVDDSKFVLGGYPVSILGVGTIYVSIDGAEYEVYDKEKTYLVKQNVRAYSSFKGSNTEVSSTDVNYATAWQTNTGRSYQSGKPVVVWLTTGNGSQANVIGRKLAQDYNLIDYQVSGKEASWQTVDANLDKADLIVMTEELGGGCALSLDIRDNLIGKVNIINMKAFHYGSSTDANARWGWGLPVEESIGNTSLSVYVENPLSILYDGVQLKERADGHYWIDLWTNAEESKKHLQYISYTNNVNPVKFFQPIAYSPSGQHFMHGADHAKFSDEGVADENSKGYLLISMNQEDFSHYSNEAAQMVSNAVKVMCDPALSLFGEVTSLPVPTVVDNEDGSAKVKTATTLAKIYYMAKDAASPAPTKDEIKAGGKYTLTGFTEKYNTNKYIWAFAELEKSDHSVISSGVTAEATLVRGNTKRYITLASDPKDLAEGAGVTWELNATETHTVPFNTCFYKTGMSVKSWKGSDGNDYTPGASNFMAGNLQDITLTAVFSANDVKLTDATVPTTVTWDFRQSHGAPAIAVENGSSSGSSSFIMGNAVIDGKILDVRLNINAATSAVNETTKDGDGATVTGKFNNTYSKKYAQVRLSTEFSFPAVNGMEVSFKGVDFPTDEGEAQYFKSTETGKSELTDGTFKESIDNGGGDHSNSGTFTYNGETLTATFKNLDPGAICYQEFTYAAGTANEHTFHVGDINYGGGFYQSLSVTYPALYTVEASVTPEESAFAKADAEGNIEAAGVIEQSVAHQNTDGKFLPDDNVIVKAKPNYGYDFTSMTNASADVTSSVTDGTDEDAGKKIYQFTVAEGAKTIPIVALFTEQTSYTLTTKAIYNADGTESYQSTVILSPDYKKYVAGTEVTLTSDCEIKYGPLKWQKKEGEGEAADIAGSDRKEAITITMPAAETEVDILLQMMTKGDVAYSANDFTMLPQSITGTFSVTPPVYHTLYKAGKTLVKWTGDGKYGSPATVSDAARSFPVGEETGLREGPNGEKLTYTLTPYYEDNALSQRLSGRSETAEITWKFVTDELAQEINVGAGQTFSLVAPASVKRGSVKTDKFDVNMDITTGSKGRVNNTNSADWCTIGNGTKLSIPACNGATIEMEVRGKISTTKFAGAVPEIYKVRYAGEEELSDYDENSKKTVTSYIYKYVYTGDESHVDVVIGDDYSFYRYLKVTLPAQETTHEVAIIDTDWTNWDAEVGADGKSGGHAGAGSLSGTAVENTPFTTHFTNEHLAMTSKGIGINKGRATGLYVAKSQLDGYITINTQKGADAPYLEMGQFANVTRIKFRQGCTNMNGSGWKVTVTGVPDDGVSTEQTEKVVHNEGKTTMPEWVEFDVYMKDCTIKFENMTTADVSAYEAMMFDLQIYGVEQTTSSQMYITTSVNNSQAGKIVASPNYHAYPKLDNGETLQYDDGTIVVLTAEPADNWCLDKWVEIDEEGNTTDLSTNPIYTINGLETNRNIQAVFKRAPVFEFTFGASNYEGSLPEKQQVDATGNFVIPQNRTLYNSDTSTLVGWEKTTPVKKTFSNAPMTDTPQTYKSGDSWYDENLVDIALSPIVKENTVSLLDVDQSYTEGVKARWEFGKMDGAPDMSIENKVGFLMTQAQVTPTEFMDLRMYIDNLESTGRGKGKVNNLGRWDHLAQVNATSLFTIPATKGMKLEICASNPVNQTLFGDINASGSVDVDDKNKPVTAGTTATYRYYGTADKALIDVYDGSYYNYIEATYYPRATKPQVRLGAAPVTGSVTLLIRSTCQDDGAKTYYSIDGNDPIISDEHLIPVGGLITVNPTVATGSIMVKAVTISPVRPDSEVEVYMVAPYDASKRKVLYLYNGKDPEYDVNKDIMYNTLMYGGTNGYDPVYKSGENIICNVLCHDISQPNYDVDIDSEAKTNNETIDNIIYVVPDGLLGETAVLPGIPEENKAKIRSYIAHLTGFGHVIVSPMKTVAQLLGKTPDPATDMKDAIITVPEGKDNLRMLDYVLMDKDNKICVSNTGVISTDQLNLNAAYMLANSVKTIIEHYSGTDKQQTDIAESKRLNAEGEMALLGTLTTNNPQLRNQKIRVFGEERDATAQELGHLVEGSMDVILEMLPGIASEITAEAWINGAKVTDESIAKVAVTKDPADMLHSIITLTGNGQERKYDIYAKISTDSKVLIFTDDGNNTDEKYWSDGTWRVSQENGFVSGNTGSVFKFNTNNGDIITITAPANYAIKKISLHGYHYSGDQKTADNDDVLWTAGMTSEMKLDFQNEPYKSMNPEVINDNFNIYNVSDDHVDGNLVAEFGLYSINSVSFKINDDSKKTDGTGFSGQFVGTFIVEYYQRAVSSVILNETNTPDNTQKEHNGAVSLTFASQMKAVEASAGVFLTKPDGTTETLTAAGDSPILSFQYWDLAPGNYTITIPFSALKDVYNNVYSGTEATAAEGKMTKSGSSYVVPFTVAPVTYDRKLFDFIVNDRDHGTTWDGTFVDGLNKLGDNTAERKRMLFLDSKEKYFIEPKGTKFTDNNSCTRLTAKNLSLIGESQKGVIIANQPAEEGMSATPTIEFKNKDCTDNYLQDLTIRDEYPYNNTTGRATAFYDCGFNTIMKNVCLESYQDTYYTQGGRCYGEDCTFKGVVDFVYGNGDHWFERCNIIVRNRYGNNVCAPSTSPSEKWGYVFNNCTIDKEEGATMVSDRNWTLARPWQGSPAATFLNTKLNILPTNVGYAYMSSTPLVVRFHEYGSRDKNGTLLDISSRSISICAPAAGSHSPLLTAEQAAQYTLRNVIGGDNGFDPREHTKQVDKITDVYVDGHTLYWTDNQEALCYFVYYLGDGENPDMENPLLIANVTDSEYNFFTNGAFRGSNSFAKWYSDLPSSGGLVNKKYDELSHGWFGIRAANQRGGLNVMSNIVEYHDTRTYEMPVSAAGVANGDDSGNVWSTVYLDFNALVPNGVKAYALTKVTAHGGGDVEETTVILQHVSNNASTDEIQDVINANQGYVLYGPGPHHAETPMSSYEFIESGHSSLTSYLSGTVGILKDAATDRKEVYFGGKTVAYSPKDTDYDNTPMGDVSAYTLATKTAAGTPYGLGFYKYNGGTKKEFSHHKAYLDTDVANRLQQENDGGSVSLAKAFRVIIIEGEATTIYDVTTDSVTKTDGYVYNLAGQRIKATQMRKGEIYIIGGKKIRY